ncbi:MAG: molybdopterin-guanine dinucleotide biosynthesis protein B [Desulfitobacteriia bacterium]|jgi:molybdopterin-guanine dinucleotide biosynthesis protein MobB
MMSKIPIISIVAARSGTGKTTFLEKLIAELTARGYRVGAIKSDAHGFAIDVPGKDSWRFAEAGARATAIIGPNKFALIQQTEQKRSLDEVAALIEDVDVILVEGYKTADKPKIEVVRKEICPEIISPWEYLLAVVTDLEDIPVPVPVLALDDYAGAAELIISKFLRK